MARSCVFVSLIAVGVAAGPAAAGPIQWSYAAEAEYDSAYGDNFLLQWIDRTGTVASAPGWDVSRSLFTTTVYPGPPRPTDMGGKVSYGFGVRLTLTDSASGESAALNYGGWYSSEWSQRWVGPPGSETLAWDWVSELSEFGNPTGFDVVELGGNRYHVRASGGGMGSAPNGILTVFADPVATPEPGTLALAGVGLAGLALIRRVRRRGYAS